MSVPVERFTTVGDLELHWFDSPGPLPPLVLLPGLTANANSFDGLIEAGLADRHRVLALDLRGRGQSGKPATGYRMADHAGDVLGLLDELGIDEAIPVGHSFGGLLALFLAAHHPTRVPKLVILDVAGPSIRSERVRELIRPSLERLGETFPSWEDYIAKIRAAPYLDGFWADALERYFRADVETLEDGSVRPRSSLEIISQAMIEGAKEDWHSILDGVAQPVLLINAPGPYAGPGSDPILTREEAEETVSTLHDGQLAEVEGNHLTMMFAEGAEAIVREIDQFLDTRE